MRFSTFTAVIWAILVSIHAVGAAQIMKASLLQWMMMQSQLPFRSEGHLRAWVYQLLGLESGRGKQSLLGFL